MTQTQNLHAIVELLSLLNCRVGPVTRDEQGSLSFVATNLDYSEIVAVDESGVLRLVED